MSSLWTEEQIQELERAGRTHVKAHIRTKAKAVLAVTRGKTHKEVAEIVDVTPHTIGIWVSRYRKLGLDGFEVKSGRGRRGQADIQEIQQLEHMDPVKLGLPDGRWNLRALQQHVPCLKSLTVSGVWRALRRAGMKYNSKNGQITKRDKTLSKSQQESP